MPSLALETRNVKVNDTYCLSFCKCTWWYTIVYLNRIKQERSRFTKGQFPFGSSFHHWWEEILFVWVPADVDMNICRTIFLVVLAFLSVISLLFDNITTFTLRSFSLFASFVLGSFVQGMLPTLFSFAECSSSFWNVSHKIDICQ